MTEYELAESYRRLSRAAEGDGMLGLRRILKEEADRLDPPRQPREWQGRLDSEGRFFTSEMPGNWPIKVREVLE